MDGFSFLIFLTGVSDEVTLQLQHVKVFRQGNNFVMKFQQNNEMVCREREADKDKDRKRFVCMCILMYDLTVTPTRPIKPYNRRKKAKRSSIRLMVVPGIRS